MVRKSRPNLLFNLRTPSLFVQCTTLPCQPQFRPTKSLSILLLHPSFSSPCSSSSLSVNRIIVTEDIHSTHCRQGRGKGGRAAADGISYRLSLPQMGPRSHRRERGISPYQRPTKNIKTGGTPATTLVHLLMRQIEAYCEFTQPSYHLFYHLCNLHLRPRCLRRPIFRPLSFNGFLSPLGQLSKVHLPGRVAH